MKSTAHLLALVIAGAWPAIAAAAPAGSVGATSSAGAFYQNQCSACHGDHMQGAFGPSLNGPAFAAKWRGRQDALVAFILANMPPSAPGSLTTDQATSLAKQILPAAPTAPKPGASAPPPKKTAAASPAPATEAEVSGGADQSMRNEDVVYRTEMAREGRVLAGLRPVSTDMLAHPDDGDWLNWRRTYDGHGFSPLKQIDRSTLAGLHQIWTLSLPHGTNEIDPVVHDGVIFVDSAGTVMAIEAASGTTLWRYERSTNVRPMGPPVSQPRSMAIGGTTLFVPTLDNHMLALDMRSGKLLWDHQIEDSKGVLRLTAGPIVVHDKVIQGVAGCAGATYQGGCFIVGLDAATGREAWRVHTLQRKGDPGTDSWAGVPDSQRFGASVWSTGTYDPVTNLVYFGTAQTYHVAPLLNAPKGSDNDALYTDSTLAIDPDTGVLKWHYQHLARDVWDMDWAYERTVTTLPFKGVDRRVVLTIGKIGIMDVLDARTGAYLYSHDLGYQNIIASIDPVTGRKTPAASAEPILNKVISLCPYSAGVRNFPSTAYDDASHTLFVPILKACMGFLWHDKSDWDISYSLKPREDSDGNIGAVLALDVVDRKVLWMTPSRTPRSTALLATAGGLVFEGGRDRMLLALDSGTGKPLWQTQLAETPNSFPVSFMAGDRQYIAVVSGGGGPVDSVLSTLTPEISDKSYATTISVYSL